MRVIAGKYKGRVLLSPEGKGVRPTSDRIKETLFNILQRYNTEGRVLDLFCGSGALGIEALSRGASDVVFVDESRESCRLAQANLDKLRIGGDCAQIHNVDYIFALKKLQGAEFDIILADPPYNNMYEQNVLRLIDKYGLLKAGGAAVIEHSSDTEFGYDESRFERDLRVYGKTALSFFSKI